MGDKILVATPFYRYIDPETECSLRDLEKMDGVDVSRKSNSNIALARNDLAQEMLTGGYDYIFYLDSDCTVTADDLQKLIALDKQVVSGLYVLLLPEGMGRQKRLVLRWAAAAEKQGERYLWLTGSLTEPMPVLVTGGGCLLVKREVLKTLKWPWFDFQLLPSGNIRGEDFTSGQKCQDAGIEVWVEPAVIAGHYKKINITQLVRRQR